MTYNCIKTTTTATAIGTGNATVASAAAARCRPLSDIPTGKQAVLRIEDEAGTDWEMSVCTILSATTFSRDVVINGAAGPGVKVNFAAGAKTVQCVLDADSFNALAGVYAVPFSQSVPLTRPGTSYMPKYTVTGPLSFTPAAGAVMGAFSYGGLVADGVSAVSFPGFKQVVGSADYDNRAGILNIFETSFDGYDYWYSLSSAVGAVPVDTVAPTIASAAVANGTPTTLTLTASEALDPNYTPAASAFAVTGHAVNGVAVAGTAVNLTVTAFANGEAARTVNYVQPATGGARDLAGNLLASFSSPLAITNNVQPVDTTPPTVSGTTAPQVANASPSVIQITMSETMAASIPPASAFSVSGGKTVSSVAIAGAVVSLTCSAAYANGDIITATYTAPASNPRLQDAAGNATVSFGPVGVTNNVAAAAVLNVPVFGSLTNVTRTGDTYTGAGGSAFSAASAMCTTKFQNGVDGSIDVKVVAKRPGTAYPEFILGVTSSATAVAYQSLPYAIYAPTFGGTYKVINSGGVANAALATVSIADTDIMRVERVGTGTASPTINLRVSSNSGPWTTIHSWTGVPTTALSIEMLFNDQFTVSPVASSGLA